MDEKSRTDASDSRRKFSFWQELTAAQGEQFFGNYQLQQFKVARGFIPTEGSLVKLFYTKFEPKHIVASIAIIHGVGQGHQSYMNLASGLAQYGFMVHTIDFRGFGYSGGYRGNYCFQSFNKDIQALINCCKRSVPLFIYAHGIGACLTISLLSMNPNLPIAGVVIASLLTSLQVYQGSLIKTLLLGMTGIFQDLLISTKVNPTSLTKDNSKIDFTPSSHLITIKMLRELQRHREYLQQNSHLFNYPIFMMHGKKDQVSLPQTTLNLFKNISSKQKSICIFQNGYHQLHNDIELKQLTDKVVEWINSKLKKSMPLGVLPKLKTGISVSRRKKRYWMGLLCIALWLLLRNKLCMK